MIRKLTEFTSFCNSVVKTTSRVLGLLKEWRTGLRAIFGKFLSAFFYLARLSSVWCVSSVIYGYEGLNTFLLLLSSVWQPQAQGTWIPMEHLPVACSHTFTRTCTNSVSVASPRLDTSFNLNVMPYILFYFNTFRQWDLLQMFVCSSALISNATILNDVMKFGTTRKQSSEFHGEFSN